MGASEQLMETVTVSGGGVTLRKQFVEDDYAVRTIQFVVANDADEERTVAITETIPTEFSADAVGFHPEYGADHWTSSDDESAEFERDFDADEEYTTVYGLKIDDTDDAEAFMSEPRLVVDGEEADEGEGASDVDAAATDDISVAKIDGDERPETSLDVENPGESTENGAENDEAVIGPSLPADAGEVTAVPGPETGSVVARLVEELRRNDVDGDQKAILREQLDLGVPSQTKARIDQLTNRVETVAAYADALEEFIDEDGTAQEVIDDFETQVSALREDIATIREQTSSNTSEIGALTDDLGSLETQVDGLEATLDDVGDQADDIEDSLSTTDSQLENVESDLRQAEDRIETNAQDVDDLDTDLSEVEGDLSDVEERVTETEDDVETLDDAAAELRNDLDDVDAEVGDVEDEVDELDETTAENAKDIQSIDADVANLDDEVDNVEANIEDLDVDIEDLDEGLEYLENDVDDIEADVEDIIEWRKELGEMFQ